MRHQVAVVGKAQQAEASREHSGLKERDHVEGLLPIRVRVLERSACNFYDGVSVDGLPHPTRQ